ncbi:ferrous iron transporter B [Candidatus Comchoanobacter bicostacola]|uniref:Ferrous iron transporter B n=1 Tax=Candidatus Comchoanobacter bicostacola TaxID=2919598 RepID=A0ABY5DKB4_9GAMM|nr:ferrous iron transporter B [Candidatus Comchoanobacter bicostacola]UTC24422.1 ferrous iron transporter B [Candidatus Comchoanobacter bicostacola]
MIECVLVGLPNVGKTTLFNRLTHHNLKTGNWSGVTVKAFSKTVGEGKNKIKLTDLPGIASVFDDFDQLDAQKALACIHAADIIVHVIDVRHLHRDLVLATQLLVLEKPIISVLSHTSGKQVQRLREVVPSNTILLDPELTLERMFTIVSQAQSVAFDSVIEWPIGFSKYWHQLEMSTPYARMQHLMKSSDSFENESVGVLAHEAFYQTVLTRLNRSGLILKRTDNYLWLDKMVLHTWFGLPIFFLAMYAMFFLTINVGGAFGELSAQLMELFINLLPSTSLIWVVIKSVGSGIAMCSSFVPILAVMFFCLAYMEQSGYLARVALLSDLLMRPLGLDGRSFIPLMLGFGCNVPAVSATRFIEGNEQRILTAMMVPFMACTARLSIFVVMASTFFSNSAPLLIMSLYILSIILAVMSALWFRYLLGMQVSQSAVITLPPYLKPSFTNIVESVRIRVASFFKSTARLIVYFSGVIGVLASIGINGQVVSASESVLALLSQWIAPAFSFMGIGADQWPLIVSLIAGVVAKEVVLTTLYSLIQISGVESISFFDQFCEVWSDFFYNLLGPLLSWFGSGEVTSSVLLEGWFTPSQALAYMVFILLYLPCLSTIAAIRTECGTFWAVLSFTWSSILAVWGARVAYNGLGVETFILLFSMAALVALRKVYDTTKSKSIVSG